MSASPLRIAILRRETWPLRAAFTISRGSRTEASVLYLRLARDGVEGHAECMPYKHYGESFESVERQIQDAVDALATRGDGRSELQKRLPAGAARNAIDCALVDLECKASGRRAWDLLGRSEPTPAVTVETIVIDTPQNMFEAARVARARPVLKIKLDGEEVVPRVRAVREGAPHSKLVVDANEAWSMDLLDRVVDELATLGVLMIEQPLPAKNDAALAEYRGRIPLCADESCHTREDLSRVRERYRMVNVKLDKAGGITEAMALCDAALELGLGLMVGCMLGTSLAMAPATLIADRAEFVDLDGPLWMAKDREAGLDFTDSRVSLPTARLWG
ncbi:MAG: N-acetyl-D-Glu racemase DgcA [Planctomycetota bacterium]